MRFIRFAFFLVHLIVAACLLAVTLNAFIPPKWFPFLNLLSLGFPILIILNAIFTLVWIVSWRKRAFLFLFVFLLVFNPLRRWVNYSSESKETANLKLVSYNVKGGVMEKKQRSEVMDYLENQNADIIFIQERPWEHFKLEGYDYSDKTLMITQVLSKHQILQTKELFEDADVQHATQADIDINGRTIRFINVYLEPFSFKKEMFNMNGDREQDKKDIFSIVKRLLQTFKKHQAQVDTIHKAISDSPYPVMVVGDFNAVPNSYEYYTLSKGLSDAFVEVGNGSATSFHDYKFPLRLDYVLASPEIKAVRYHVDRTMKSSDHFPVISEFKMP